MTTIEFIRQGLERSTEMTLKLVDDMHDQSLTFPTPKGGNHPLWVIGHLAYAEGELHRLLLGRDNPIAHWKDLFGAGTEPSASAARYPAFEAARSAFQELRGETIKAVGALRDADLDRPIKDCPPELEQFLGTRGRCFLLAIMHPLMHYGQVADARRAVGKKPLMM
jgi:hypothetical protein